MAIRLRPIDEVVIRELKPREVKRANKKRTDGAEPLTAEVKFRTFRSKPSAGTRLSFYVTRSELAESETMPVSLPVAEKYWSLIGDSHWLYKRGVWAVNDHYVTAEDVLALRLAQIQRRDAQLGRARRLLHQAGHESDGETAPHGPL